MTRGHRWIWGVCGLILSCGLNDLIQAATPPPRTPNFQDQSETPAAASPITQAFETALSAANMAQSASTSEEWYAVAEEWAAAIGFLQSMSPERPQWIFAQRKAREYLANQAIALQRAEEAGAPVVFPTLGSEVLDEQLGLYLSYLATFGPPDVMIIGSSRALQGINPQILQQRLDRQGYGSLQVYNFAVNGATAQGISFILRSLLTPEQLPRMVVWAGGSRSFNSARVDRTFAQIADSPGYAALQQGDRPELDWTMDEASSVNASAEPIPVSSINGYGFLPIADVFNPATYYRTFPRVAGIYDASYQPFDLAGVQTQSLRAIADYTETRGIPLVFVNLPLSNDFLDDTRLFYERQFQDYLQREAAAGGFIVVDFLDEWPTQNWFFADPSHLNQAGAAQLAIQLAEMSTLPWRELAEADSGDDASQAE